MTLMVLDAIAEMCRPDRRTGHDSGCSTLDGLHVRLGDRLIFSVDALAMVEHPSLSQHVLAWRRRVNGWRFATGLL